MARLSVVVPAYKAEAYLETCLNSILNQTMKDLELIVVDDGSPDKTGEIADAVAGRDARVRVIHKKNEGAIQARKCGIEAAGGSWIAFADADDWLEPDMYAELLRIGEEKNADIVCAAYFEDGADGGSVPRLFEGDLVQSFTVEQAVRAMHTLTGITPFMWNKIHRRYLFEGLHHPQGNLVGEDYFLEMEMLQKAERIFQLNEPLYHYVVHPGSLSRSGFDEQRKRSYELHKKLRTELLKKYPKIADEIWACYLREEAAILVAMGRNGRYDPQVAAEITQDARKHGKALRRSGLPTAFKVAGTMAAVHGKLLYGASRVSSLLHR